MLDIRPLRVEDIPAALRLSTQAGWNQIEADWRRLIDLWPSSCLAGWDGSRLVATGTLATYGTDPGWIGMILVDEACRGRGFGGAIFDAVLRLADETGVKCLGLDATDLGRPVYLKRGFVDVVGIDRWVRPAAPVIFRESALAASIFVVQDTKALADCDVDAVGFDRGSLLQHLAADTSSVGVAMRDGNRPTAFGFARAGRRFESIGPLVAEDAA